VSEEFSDIKEARRILSELDKEVRVVHSLTNAMKTRDINSIASVLSEVESMDIDQSQFKEIVLARDLIERIKHEQVEQLLVFFHFSKKMQKY
jgi:hypothetical protein